MSSVVVEATLPHASDRRTGFHVRHNSNNDSHKRKRSETFDVVEQHAIFSAKTVKDGQKILSFEHVETILRAHLPLAWLSTENNVSSMSSGLLVEAVIPSFKRWDYHVLIAREVSNGRLYAFEKVDDNIFVVHLLQLFVTNGWVQQAAIGAVPLVTLEQLSSPGHQSSSCDTNKTKPKRSLSQSIDVKIPRNLKGAAARLSILTPQDCGRLSKGGSPRTPPSLDEDVTLVMSPEKSSEGNDAYGVQEDVGCQRLSESFANCSQQQVQVPLNTNHSNDDDNSAQQRQSDMLSPTYLRQRYLEHLYMSRTSLAYYTKGPLSRARARARATDSNVSLEALASFYRSILLPAKKLDTKYRDSLRKAILELPTNVSNSNTPAKKRTKRTKLGKDGLWPCEGEFIGKWWQMQEFPGVSGDRFLEDATDEAISKLRMRETEMQIILMLEILSLEAKAATRNVSEPLPVTSETLTEAVDRGPDNPKINPNSKSKIRNLKRDLETLVDKLCIWHSVGLEATIDSPEKSRSERTTGVGESKDRLRNFCSEIIIPFYSAKVSEECKKICKSLGGPEIPPQRPSGNHHRSSSAPKLVPGSAIREHTPVAQPKALERVLSESNARHDSPPALTRSSTLPPVPTFAREPSDMSQRPLSRGGMHKSVSFSNREVDLVADAKASSAKKRKLDIVASQKRELQAAIETLRKPNRSGVAKGYMEDLEKRSTSGTKKTAQSVQISATPRSTRRRVLEVDEYDLPPMAPLLAGIDETHVPSSTMKARSFLSSSSIPQSSAKKRAVLTAIYDTPSRRAKTLFDPLNSTSNPRAGVKDIEHGSSATPSKLILSNRDPDVDCSPSISSISNLKELRTPVRRANSVMSNGLHDLEDIPEAAGKIMDRAMGIHETNAQVSIYDSLG